MTNPKRIVLITGAGSGLGRGLSICLAEEGHSILATDLHLESARETAAQIEAAGGAAAAHRLDVASEEDINRLMRDIGQHRIDALINNAGLQHVATLEEFPV